MADFVVKQDDLEPPIAVTLLGADGNPPALGFATSIKVRVADVLTKTEIIFADATLDDVDAGDISYSFVAGDTSVAGTYYVEFVVEWPDDRPQTYPPTGYLVLTIEPKL